MPDVVTHQGEPLHVDCVIGVEWLRVVRDLAGRWYVGESLSETDDIECWECCGPDLGVALSFW
ncbi:hypothetical protein B4N89_16800 [Embleya scabrispora]|uniref:Uncharacterized protein n=1 Tax=Embleya scabrispora TaxID=159449 RepID=A0A1T3NZU6_9ACTN|nr:hypothetical protein [Embleya scabrispora]OPC82376.1 hypothetical protein B4N89_16800 [Embleya scabrispora]